MTISIHAPVKGATDPLDVIGPQVDISIHAPVKGATNQDERPLWAGTDFNPRTREGCNLSPHRLIYRRFRNFNPRTREGCDTKSAGKSNILCAFQSTHP